MSIDLEVRDHVATITINRPERMNALDTEAYTALSAAWTRVRDDSNIRVAVVTGAGEKSFCAGADIKSFLSAGTSAADFWATQKEQILNRGLEVWKPVIAAVNGHCLGGGMTMLLATDIRVAAPDATFGLTEVVRGVIPANGGTQRILEQLPHPLAMELLLGGEAWDARKAERWGLVNAVVPADQLMDHCQELARKLAANAPLAVQAAKELALRSREMDRAAGFRLEQAMLAVLQGTEDAAEGIAAFREGRAPVFGGR